MTVSDTHADTIRAALMSPGMDAYEEEREPDAEALAALDALVTELEEYDGRLLAVGETAERERARADRLTKALVQHHAMHNLSNAAVRESIGRTCQICARAALSASSEATP